MTEIKKDVVPVAFVNIQKLCSDLEVKAVGLAREIRQSADVYQQEQENQKRESEKAVYELAQKRRQILDKQAEEDRERQIRIQDEERIHALNIQSRNSEIENGKKHFIDMVCDVLEQKVTVENFDPRKVRQELVSKMEAQKVSAFNAGKAEAKKELDTDKKLFEAGLATKISLLEEKEKITSDQNKALLAENRRLQDQMAQMTEKMAEMPAGAFNAAAGIVSKGNDALASAAQSGANRTTNR